MPTHPIVSSEQWTRARKALLQKEKDFMQARDELSRLRRELPWERVEKNYVFDTTEGEKALGELFGGRSQLYRDSDGSLFHTYSTYARGIDNMNAAYQYLDLVPKGRDEDALPSRMAWLAHRDRYEKAQ